MIAGERVGYLVLAMLAGSGLARAQEAALPAAAPADAREGPARSVAAAPLSIRSASLLRAASASRDARGEARQGWPALETVDDTPGPIGAGSRRPTHRLELMHLADDSSVLVTYKRSRPQLIWRKSLD